VVGAVVAEITRRQSLSPQSHVRFVGLIERFVRFATARGGVDLPEVTQEIVEAFLVSLTARRQTQPSVATMRLRRWAVRLFFHVAQDLGLASVDPTARVSVESEQGPAPRPLTHTEVAACRSASLRDLTSTRLSTAWALGEATARTSEIPRVRVADIDLTNSRIWIDGSARTIARWGTLTAWGAVQVARCIDELGELDPETRLADLASSNWESRVSFSSQTLRETLERAGLGSDSRVAPGSLAAWRGRQILEDSGRIEVAARALGVRSLDVAARIMDWQWRDATDLADG
jgi:integrase